MSAISYLCFAFSAWIFSQWTWNRCCAIGGNKKEETLFADVYFSLAVVATIYGVRNLL